MSWRKKKGNKYGAKRTTVHGITFASKKEAKRYEELLWHIEQGDIADLELQPKFPIHVKEKKICTYIADFEYTVTNTGERVVEDVKGRRTPIFNLKKKLFEAVYERELLIT